MTKVERIRELLRRLQEALGASSAAGAFALLTRTFTAVEDELAGDDDPMFQGRLAR